MSPRLVRHVWFSSIWLGLSFPMANTDAVSFMDVTKDVEQRLQERKLLSQTLTANIPVSVYQIQYTSRRAMCQSVRKVSVFCD